MFTRLGVLVPILVSVALFGERPALLQGVGMVLAVAAAVLMNGLPEKPEFSSPRNKVYLLPLLLTLLLNGTSDAMSKVFTQLGRRQDDGLFMFYIFLFAGLATLALLVRRHQPLTGRDIFLRGTGGRAQLSFFPASFGRSYPAAGLPGLPFLQRGGDSGHQRGQFLPVSGTAEPPPDGGGRDDSGCSCSAQFVTFPVILRPAPTFSAGAFLVIFPGKAYTRILY